MVLAKLEEKVLSEKGGQGGQGGLAVVVVLLWLLAGLNNAAAAGGRRGQSHSHCPRGLTCNPGGQTRLPAAAVPDDDDLEQQLKVCGHPVGEKKMWQKIPKSPF
jgi:hypothetical protein